MDPSRWQSEALGELSGKEMGILLTIATNPRRKSSRMRKRMDLQSRPRRRTKKRRSRLRMARSPTTPSTLPPTRKRYQLIPLTTLPRLKSAPMVTL